MVVSEDQKPHYDVSLHPCHAFIPGKQYSFSQPYVWSLLQAKPSSWRLLLVLNSGLEQGVVINTCLAAGTLVLALLCELGISRHFICKRRGFQ